jgi:Rad3-related DNA helicase
MTNCFELNGKQLIFLDIETSNEQLDFTVDTSELVELWAYNPSTKETFHRFVRISHPLSEFTKRFCKWITQEDIDWWVSPEKAIQDFSSFVWNSSQIILVGHNLEKFDVAVLKKYDNIFGFSKVAYLDTMHLFFLLYPWLASYTVEDLYKNFVNDDYHEQHRALQDSIDEAELFEKCLTYESIKSYYATNWKSLDVLWVIRWKNRTSIKNNTVKWWMENDQAEWITTLGNHIFWERHETLNQIYEFIDIVIWQANTLEYHKLKKWNIFKTFFPKFEFNNLKNSKYNYDQDPLVTTQEEINKIYESVLPEWMSSRISQLQIIQWINEYLNNNQSKKWIGIEAWTGVWKTFSYLIPWLQYVNQNPNYKLFVSTYTKILQNQIMDKDINPIAKHFKNVSYAHLKANSNWIDLNKLPLKSKNHTLYHIILRHRIYRWSYYIDDIHYWIQKYLQNITKLPLSEIIYNPLEVYNKWDLNKDFWFKWHFQHTLHNNNVFVVNHAFIASQFGNYIKDSISGFYEPKETILPFKSIVLYDEWHNVEHVTRDYFTLDYSLDTFRKIEEWIQQNITGGGVIYKYISEIINNANELSSINNPIIKERVTDLEFFCEKFYNRRWDQVSDTSKIKLKNVIDSFSTSILHCLSLAEIKLKNVIDSFSKSNLHRLSLAEIKKLREKYEINEVTFKKQELVEHYFSSKKNDTLSLYMKISYDNVRIISKFIKDLDAKYENILSLIDDNSKKEELSITNYVSRNISLIQKYYEYWCNLVSTRKPSNNNYVISWYVCFNKWLESVTNFWFRCIPINLTSFKPLISDKNIFLSATLLDYSGKQSFIMNEMIWFDNEQKTLFDILPIIKSPFKYNDQRNITYADINSNANIDTIFQEKINITLSKIREYWWRTLILTTNSKIKDQIANQLSDKLSSEWYLIKKHQSGSMSSKSNRQNVEMLRINPKTVLIWSKSYMEWVDVAWDNLQLVILWNLPYLPPTAFLEYMNELPRYRTIDQSRKYVYHFYCSILFRQSIWRLIRSMNDTWEILILDPRINQPSWSFFRHYLDWEELKLVNY